MDYFGQFAKVIQKYVRFSLTVGTKAGLQLFWVVFRAFFSKYLKEPIRNANFA